MKRIVIVIVLALGATVAGANEAAIRRMIEQRLGGDGRIESVRKAPWGERYSGAMPIEKVRALFDAASPTKR